jgi:hypothetical protein
MHFRQARRSFRRHGTFRHAHDQSARLLTFVLSIMTPSVDLNRSMTQYVSRRRSEHRFALDVNLADSAEPSLQGPGRDHPSGEGELCRPLVLRYRITLFVRAMRGGVLPVALTLQLREHVADDPFDAILKRICPLAISHGFPKLSTAQAWFRSSAIAASSLRRW